MKKTALKKIMIAALTGILLTGMTLTVNAAPAGREGGCTGQQNAEAADGERPELPEKMQNGERPELPADMQNGERPELPADMQNGENPELPEDTDASVSGDRTAGKGKRGDMENGVKPEKKEKPESGKKEGEPGELPEGAVNIMAYEDALNKEEDESVKNSLQSYIDALKDALDAERTALDGDTELSEDEKTSLRDAVSKAEEALKTAFEDAGIEVTDEKPEADEELPEGVAGASENDDDKADAAQKEASTKTVGRGSAAGGVSASGSVKKTAETTDSGTAGAKKEPEENTWTKITKWISDLFR